jgi:hypothetical protein
MAAHTVSRSIMLAWMDTTSRRVWPAAATHREPAWAATAPVASTMATCRIASLSSPATRARSAVGAA